MLVAGRRDAGWQQVPSHNEAAGIQLLGRPDLGAKTYTWLWLLLHKYINIWM